MRLQETSIVAEATSNPVIIANSAGKIEWVNNAFEQSTGYKLDDILGQKAESLLYGEGTNAMKTAEIKLAMELGQTFQGTILSYTKTGKPYWNELNLQHVKDGAGKILKYVFISKDVSDRVRRNQEHLFDELRWKFALEKSGDGYFEYDIAGQNFFASANLLALTGFDKTLMRLDFKSFISILHPDESEQAVSIMVDLIAGKLNTFSTELRLKKAGGDYAWVAIRATIVNKNTDGTPLTVLGTVTDISHIKETEQALAAAKAEAEKISAYKNHFLATMSHEIRTPLNAIVGLTNLMKLKKPQGELGENLDILSFSAHQLLSLVNDVLDFSKIESGKMEFHHSDFDLRETVNGVCNSFIPKCMEQGIHISCSVDPHVPEIVTGDSMRLVQILNNLVNNAVKFTPKGWVQLKISSAKTEKTGSVQLFFEVIDTGIGISKSIKKKIFEDFVQADVTTSQKYGGTGLGLAITKKLVELQGGQIDFESAKGKGSKFYFNLPFGSRQLAGKSGNSKPIQAPKTDIAGIKVLLVEDILVNQKVAAAYLNNWGAEVQCADNGKEALKIFKDSDFDVALIDLYMPVMNGFEAMKRIRKTAKGRRLGIIALTASADENTLRQAIASGANGCINKPFDALQLLHTIKKVTGFKGQAAVEPAMPKAVVKSKFNYINMQALEEASLGSREFMVNMIDLLKQEIPSTIGECKNSIGQKNFIMLAGAVHKLKNSMLLIGFKKIKTDLIELEDMAKNAPQPEKINAAFQKIVSVWNKAEKELARAGAAI